MNIIQTERAAQATSQSIRFAAALHHVKATDGRDIVVETEHASGFRVTVWGDFGRQCVFAASGKTANSALRKGAAFVYGKEVARLTFSGR